MQLQYNLWVQGRTQNKDKSVILSDLQWAMWPWVLASRNWISWVQMYISAEMTKTKPGNFSPGITSSCYISEQSTKQCPLRLCRSWKCLTLACLYSIKTNLWSLKSNVPIHTLKDTMWWSGQAQHTKCSLLLGGSLCQIVSPHQKLNGELEVVSTE